MISKIGIVPILFFVYCIGMTVQADAECWRWTAKTLQGPEWKSGFSTYFMAFDEASQKIALTTQDYETKEFKLWTYDGKSWQLIWDQLPQMDPGLHFGYPFGMVFDRNHMALVIFAGYFTGSPESGGAAAFKFVPGIGWQRISHYFQLSSSVHGPQGVAVAYDTLRKRSIIIGSGEWRTMRPITVEFDGSQLYTVYNTPEYTLYYGTAGFDPETGKTVFYGFGRGEDEQLETFEYDGVTWRLGETTQRPFTEFDPVSGMVYVPQLHGLVAVPSNHDSFQTWVYRNSEWKMLSTENLSPFRDSGLFAFNSTNHFEVYWGGFVAVEGGVTLSHDTLEFKYSRHCLPLHKP